MNLILYIKVTILVHWLGFVYTKQEITTLVVFLVGMYFVHIKIEILK